VTTSAPSAVRSIKARRTRFDLNDTPLHWIPEDPQATHLINVLHLMLPPGERWFCDVYREALPLITDEQLREDVKGFMGQEATHARAHELGLDYLARNGIDTSHTMRQAEWLRTNLGSATPFGLRLPGPIARWWLIARLSSIAAIEHFTAVLGHWILNDSAALDDDGADPQMLDLLRWHGAEEVEHRAVAFDLFEHLSGSYARRLISMIFVALALTLGFVVGTNELLRADPVAKQRFSARRFNQSAGAGHHPTLTYVLAAIPRYLRRDHHPSMEGNTEIARAYLATSPGVIKNDRSKDTGADLGH
jgi:predicted metal-dependent hydrolase